MSATRDSARYKLQLYDSWVMLFKLLRNIARDTGNIVRLIGIMDINYETFF